jgi:hypothetical protein
MKPLLALLLLPIAFGGPALQSKQYADPAGAFNIQIPSNWEANRSPLDEGVTLFEFGKDENGPRVDVITVDSGGELQASQLDQAAEAMFSLVVQFLEADGRVTSRRQARTTFAGVAAVRSDLTFTDSDGAKFRGHLVVVLGKRYAILGAAYAQERDAAGYQQAESVLNTLTGPGLSTGSGSAAGARGVAFDKSALAATANKIKGGLQRDTLDKVLVPGDPPLTHGSVVNFVQVLNHVFEMELTEIEFEATKQRFIEYYQKNDAEGKRILALGGQQILEGYRSMSKEELAAQSAEIRQAMASRFEAGAKAGIGYAQTLWEAIQRRSKNLKSVAANVKPANDKVEWSREFSEADLDSALEMLYFMWVASGRDAEQVTPEAVQQVRAMLVQNFDKFDPQFQLILANSQRIYSGLRGQYMQASPQERAILAQQYGQALDSMGLTVPTAGGGGGGGGGGSAWDDVKGYDSGQLRGELMMNSAFLSVNSWHR